MIIKELICLKNAPKLPKVELTQEVLRSVLSYSPETGLFHWLVRSANRVRVGNPAGCISEANGYLVIGYKFSHHLAHRLAFLYMTGEWPKHEVDHINTIRSDNRWVNLRDVRHIVNMQNKQRLYKNNTSGAMGVSRVKRSSKWLAQIWIDGGSQEIGYYSTITEASDAYQEAKRALHPGYAAVRAAAPTRQMQFAF